MNTPAREKVPSALEALANALALAVLSNGTPAMLEQRLSSAGIYDHFTHVLSDDQAGIYKPSRDVYATLGDATTLSATEIRFVSANTWDVAGAKSFGLKVAWINRKGEPMDVVGFEADHELTDVSQIGFYLTDGP